MSPILFSMYVNDCESHLSDHCPHVEIQMLNLFLIMYADDMVLLAEIAEGLRTLLNSLSKYTHKWDLTLNTNKSKVVVFRNSGKLRDNERWYYNGCQLESVNEFNYLRILLFYNGKFSRTQKIEQHNKGVKHYFQYLMCVIRIILILKQCCLCLIHMLILFLVMDPRCGVFTMAKTLKRSIYCFVKQLLGLRKGTCNDFIYSELGRFPLYITRKLRIVKYWIKLCNTNTSILRAVCDEMNQGGDNWLMNVKHELNIFVLNYIWNVPFIDDSTYKLIKERLLDVYKQQCYNRITATAKGNLYKHLINGFRLQTYLTQPLDFRYLRDSKNQNVCP